MREVRRRIVPVLVLPILLAPLLACDIATADFKSHETAEWRKSYELQAGGRLEVSNVNGKISVVPSAGNTVEILAVKTARASTPEAARQALDAIEIVETSSPSAVKIETRLPRNQGFLHRGGGEVRYTITVPASAEARLKTVNGGIELAGLAGRVDLETTNGGITARDVSGPIDAATTNGGLDVEVARVVEPGVKLECTNGGIRLRLPADAKANISATVTNGGIDTGGLSLDILESSRRRLEARLNGGGPAVRVSGTNGGIRIGSR